MKAGMFALRIGAALAASLMLGSLAVAGDHWTISKSVIRSKAARLGVQDAGKRRMELNWISPIGSSRGDTSDMDFGTSKGDCTVSPQIHLPTAATSTPPFTMQSPPPLYP